MGASFRRRWRVKERPGACSLRAEVRDERTERTEVGSEEDSEEKDDK